MKKYIIGFMSGLFVCGIIGISAATYLYHADEVSFTPKNTEWNVDDVDGALKDLYDKVNKPTPTAKLVGTYTGAKTIDVSSYGATSASQFLIQPVGQTVSGTIGGYVYTTLYGYISLGKCTLNGSSLTVTSSTLRLRAVRPGYDDKSTTQNSK